MPIGAGLLLKAATGIPDVGFIVAVVAGSTPDLFYWTRPRGGSWSESVSYTMSALNPGLGYSHGLDAMTYVKSGTRRFLHTGGSSNFDGSNNLKMSMSSTDLAESFSLGVFPKSQVPGVPIPFVALDDFRAIARNTSGRIVAGLSSNVANYASNDKLVYTNDDGANWLMASVANSFGAFQVRFRGIAYSPSLDSFVGVGMENSAVDRKIWSSADGITWTLRDTRNVGETWDAVGWDGTRFIAFGGSTFATSTSPDGTTWAANVAVPFSENLSGAWIAADGVGNICIATNGNTRGDIFRSTNAGASWTRVVSSSVRFRGIKWATLDGKFYAIRGNATAAGELLESTTGASWSTVTIPTDKFYLPVALAFP